MPDKLSDRPTIDLISELQNRSDFYGVILFVRNPPSDQLAVLIPPHVAERDADSMLTKAAQSGRNGQ